MLILSSTSDLVRVVTGAAADIEVHASWLDVTGTPQVVTPGRTNTPSIVTATTTTIVASPAASTQRNVKRINITNNHASVASTVAIEHTDGTNVVELIEVTLLNGENLVMGEDGQFHHYDANGGEYVSIQGGPITIKSLAADQSNSTTTPTEVVGLTVAVAPGNYAFEYYIRYQAAVNTTGVKFSVNHSGTVNAFIANVEFVTALATAADANPDQDVVTATGGLIFVFAARAKSTAGWGVTLGTDTGAADMFCRISGMMTVTATGNLQLWHGSEVAAASTVKLGTMLVLVKG